MSVNTISFKDAKIFQCFSHLRSFTKAGERIDGIEVLHIDQISYNDCSILFPSIGDNQNRYNIIKSLESCSYSFPSIISPQAFVDSSATIGKGCFISSFAYVGPHAHMVIFQLLIHMPYWSTKAKLDLLYIWLPHPLFVVGQLSPITVF